MLNAPPVDLDDTDVLEESSAPDGDEAGADEFNTSMRVSNFAIEGECSLVQGWCAFFDRTLNSELCDEGSYFDNSTCDVSTRTFDEFSFDEPSCVVL